jgi:hypothetical protein
MKTLADIAFAVIVVAIMCAMTLAPLPRVSRPKPYPDPVLYYMLANAYRLDGDVRTADNMLHIAAAVPRDGSHRDPWSDFARFEVQHRNILKRLKKD